jgi:hypothetical protein
MSVCACISPPHCHNNGKCTQPATDDGLCDVCALCKSLNGSCGLPCVSSVPLVVHESELEPLAKVWSGQAVTDALDRAISEEI